MFLVYSRSPRVVYLFEQVLRTSIHCSGERASVVLSKGQQTSKAKGFELLLSKSTILCLLYQLHYSCGWRWNESTTRPLCITMVFEDPSNGVLLTIRCPALCTSASTARLPTILSAMFAVIRPPTWCPAWRPGAWNAFRQLRADPCTVSEDDACNFGHCGAQTRLAQLQYADR
jgi:hypothetical protein